jgi:pimeloyl-ACP methyl ester carboxylesterase
MAQIEKKYIQSADGMKIYYETCIAEVSAPVVFLVHGIGGDTDGWNYVRDILIKEGLSTVALDVRGHGYSAHPKRAKDYAMDLILKDILHVIDAEHLGKVVLVGHSGGAVLALNFALAYPDRLSGLVLLAGSYLSPAYMRSPVTKRIADILVAIGAFISPPPMRPWHSTYPKGKVHKEYEPWGLVRTMAHNSLRSYLLLGREMMNVQLEDRLAEVAVPTLLVAGEKDTIYPVAISQVMHEKIPGSRLEIVKGANHVLILNNVEETAAFIASFANREV